MVDVRRLHHGRDAFTTQAGVAMSSGELGMKALYRDIGYSLPLRLWTDSSTAIGICSRQGFGKLRHLECTSFWMQQRIRHGEVEVRKIAGEVNPADLCAKHLESKAKIEQLIGLFGGVFRGGRAEAALQLRKDPAVAGMVDALFSLRAIVQRGSRDARSSSSHVHRGDARFLRCRQDR